MPPSHSGIMAVPGCSGMITPCTSARRSSDGQHRAPFQVWRPPDSAAMGGAHCRGAIFIAPSSIFLVTTSECGGATSSIISTIMSVRACNRAQESTLSPSCLAHAFGLFLRARVQHGCGRAPFPISMSYIPRVRPPPGGALTARGQSCENLHRSTATVPFLNRVQDRGWLCSDTRRRYSVPADPGVDGASGSGMSRRSSVDGDGSGSGSG